MIELPITNYQLPTTTPPSMIVYKLDEHGREVWSYPVSQVLQETDHFICVEAFFNRDDYDLGYTVFKRGDRFVEYFYNDRWFNIFVIYDRDDGRLKGWYCNVCRPAVWGDGRIACDDLALDVWIAPEGSTLVLDEEEFADLDISERDRQQGQAAVQQLLKLAESGNLPR